MSVRKALATAILGLSEEDAFRVYSLLAQATDNNREYAESDDATDEDRAQQEACWKVMEAGDAAMAQLAEVRS